MKAIIKTAIDAKARTLTFTVEGAGEVTMHIGNLSPELYEAAAFHGLKQRISDAAALSRDTETGAPASPADKLAEMRRVVAHLESGTSEWSMRPAGGGGGESLTIRALANIKAISVEQARERVAALAEKRFNGDEKKAMAVLRSAPEVAAEIARLRGPAKVNADEVLGEI